MPSLQRARASRVAVASRHAKRGGFSTTHIRDEADKSFAALEEEIAIGERAHIPLQHSHAVRLASGGKAQTPGIIARLRAVRGVRTFSRMPIPTTLELVHQSAGARQAVSDPKSVERRALDRRRCHAMCAINTDFPPNRAAIEMKTLQQLAKSAGDLAGRECSIRVIREGEAGGEDAGIICQAMTEADIKERFISSRG